MLTITSPRLGLLWRCKERPNSCKFPRVFFFLSFFFVCVCVCVGGGGGGGCVCVWGGGGGGTP